MRAGQNFNGLFAKTMG